MKKGFTLIELLIVVVVLATLMSIVFRIGNIGDESERRAITIQRIQRLENALSGYYAAFGMYPPVKLHGSRNIYRVADGRGGQKGSGDENENIWGWVSSDGESVTNWNREREAWGQVSAACRAQPVSCEFPFSKEYRDLVTAASEELKDWAQNSETMPPDVKRICAAGFDDGVTDNIGRHAKNKGKTEWGEIKLFKFGLMSYLLPRYLVMMNGDKSFFREYAQWTGNNTSPSDAYDGRAMDWSRVHDLVNSDQNNEMMRVANIPSQAVCARWMACFENVLACNANRTIFGIQIRGDDADSIPHWNEESASLVGAIYNPDSASDSPANDYILDCITMRDGWWRDVYYYSPEPYQTYQVWSAGANGRTFPPWISREKLSGDANRCVSYWTKDDIVGLKN